MPDPYEVEHRNLKEIVRRLGSTEKWPGNKLPCDYLVLDTETTGTNTSMDSIVQIGVCMVKDCKPVHDHFDTDYTSFMLKLPKEKFFGKEAAIKVHGIDFERSNREGIDPQQAYKLLYDIVMDAKSKGMYICGHNLYSFDIPFFQYEFHRMGIDFKFAQNEVVDTAMLVKAMQVGILPGETETSYAYWSRVRDLRAKGIYFNLDRYCVSRFNLEAKYGVNKSSAHDAGYDCWLAHLLVLEMNRIITS